MSSMIPLSHHLFVAAASRRPQSRPVRRAPLPSVRAERPISIPVEAVVRRPDAAGAVRPWPAALALQST